MTVRTVSVGVVGLLVALAGSVFPVAPHTLVAQSDPHAGTWVLNVAKSKYSPGPGPKEQTAVYSPSGDGFLVETKVVSADGKQTTTSFMVSFDGKDHPAKGNADWDAVASRRIDSHTIEFARKRGGKTVQTATSVVSKDGKTRTITATGVNAQGQKMSTVGVFEKK